MTDSPDRVLYGKNSFLSGTGFHLFL